VNLKRKYELFASYSLAPGLVLYIGFTQYLYYTRDVNLSVFTDILLIDVLIQVLLSIVSACIISGFWLLPLGILEDRKEEVRDQ
jgi:hypothetical protein